ncbi:MAG: hypothetical protein ACYDGR_13590, partial [Candidatus Dormibacteria bacterium]
MSGVVTAGRVRSRSRPLALPRVNLRPLARYAIPLLLYSLLSLVTFRLAWSDPTHLANGDPGDLSLFLWFMRWTPYAVQHHQSALFTNWAGYPHGLNLMWNTPVYLLTLLLGPLTSLRGPVFSYNVLVTLAPTLSAFAGFIALRRYVSHNLPALLGGALYGFSPYVMAQSLGHPNLSMVFAPPLFLLLLDEIYCRRRVHAVFAGACLGLVAGAQLLVSEEILATSVLCALVGTVVLAVLAPRRAIRAIPRVVLAMTVAVVVGLSIATVPMYVQFFGPNVIHGGIYAANSFGADLLSFVEPYRLVWLSPDDMAAAYSHFTGNVSEWDTYIGAPLLVILGIVTVRAWPLLLVRVSALMVLLMAALSLGPSLHVNGQDLHIAMPEQLVDRLPLLSDLIPSRLGLYMYLFLAILLAVAVDGVQRWLAAGRTRRPRPVSALVPAMGFVAALFPLFPTIDYPASIPAVPAFFSSAAVRRLGPDDVVLSAPYNDGFLHNDSMRWQSVAGMRYRIPEGAFLGVDAAGHTHVGPDLLPLTERMILIERGVAAPYLIQEVSSSFYGDLARMGVSTV